MPQTTAHLFKAHATPARRSNAAALIARRVGGCIVTALCLLVVGLCAAAPLAAQSPGQSEGAPQGWEVTLAGLPYGPPAMLGITKDKQQVLLFEQHSPLSLIGQLPCSTGERDGDKFRAGDLKTPEGVYFVGKRIEARLDYEMYGDGAFALNFPNPIDKIKGKTGSGIWIHGKGHDPGPRETQGCVALGNKDLAQLTQKLQYGMPVVIANSLSWTDRVLDGRTPSELVSKVAAWARLWEDGDPKFFEFYDPDKFSRSGESFKNFKEHKLQQFNATNWRQVRIGEMRVVAGPDYWVTYFGQYYRTGSLTTEGIKRLYWQKDEKGAMRIVGNEWESANLGMERRYVDDSVQEVMALLESWRAAWEKGDVQKYMSYYDPKASQGDRVGQNSIRDHKLKLWKEKRPQKVAIDDLQAALHPDGLKVSFIQGYQADGNFKDKGYKTILLQPRGDSWRIVKEEWSAM